MFAVVVLGYVQEIFTELGLADSESVCRQLSVSKQNSEGIELCLHHQQGEKDLRL